MWSKPLGFCSLNIWTTWRKTEPQQPNLQARFTRQLLTKRFLQNIDLGSLGYARHYRLLKEINVAYPKSLPEQQRIVSILDEAFSVIERSRNNANKTSKTPKNFLKAICRGITPLQGYDAQPRRGDIHQRWASPIENSPEGV